MKTKSTIVISIFMTLALLMGFAQASPAQARDIIINAVPTLDMTPATATATTCGTVDVNVRVNNVVDLTGYHLEVTYDPDLIEITNVVNGGFLTNSTELPGLFEPTNWEPGDNSGTILFGMAQRGEDGDPDPKDGTGNLITISLKALVPTGSTTLTIDPLTSMLVDWPDAFEIEHEVTGGATINLSSCAPTDITLSNTSITENMAIGTVIGSLGASDPDIGDTAFTYSLVSGFGDNARFQIVGDELQSGEVFNYEVEDTYSIKVLVTDPHGASFEKAFTISINNANDVPVMSAIGAQTVSNTGTLSFTPTASDEDSDLLTWYLGSGSPSWVSINATTGEVTLAPTPAVEPNNYQAEVCVTDGVFPFCRMFTIIVTDGVSPILEAVTPARGNVYLAAGQNFVLTVDAADDNLYSLEIDHSFGDYSLDPTDQLYLPEFTVYASASNVYGSQEAEDAFGTYGVSVTYDETTQTWAIDFGANITNTNFIPEGVTFYLVLKDAEGNTWGSMEPTTPANTFAYSVIRDDVAPIMEAVTPPEGDVYLAGGENFVLTVDALDTNLFKLEVDHSMEADPTVPEFSVYAFEETVDFPAGPYGSLEAKALFAAAGVTVVYDEDLQKWTIDFGAVITNKFITNGGITFFMVLEDLAGNEWGTMYGTTPENTFAYHLIRDDVAPVLVSVTPPDESEVKLGIGDTFTLTIVAEDVNLRELEIDHSMEDTLREFSVYASESDPYGGDIADFNTAGVTVTYTAATQTWVIDFGATVSAAIANNGGISFYLVLEDMAGNTWGSMYDVQDFNTFAYTVSQDLVAPTISSVVANGATGFPSVTAVGSTLTVDQGYQVATIDITMSEPVAVALGTQVTITPAGGVYGTVTAVNGAVITITPATGNELAAVLGTFTFSVPAGVVEDLYGNPWANVPVSLAVVDGTDPVMEAVLPAEGLITLGLDDTFVLTVDAFDLNLYELEIDHSFGGPGLTPADPLYLPEFSVYASEETPWGTEADKAMFDAAGVSISYDADLQQWTINFGEAITDSRFIPYGVTFYMVLHDEADNKWGSMDPTTSENTFAYTFEVTNTLEIEIAAAPSYLYADGYVYVGDSVFDDPNNIYTNTYSPAEFLAEDAMNDLARYLGALYRQDDSTIISIVYDGVTFTWNTAEPNTGSNWFNGTTSLVSAMVADYLATGGDLVITVQDGWHEANVTFKLVITNTLDEELESAPDYVYDPVYTYVGSRVFDDEANIYTVTYDDVDFNPGAMNDLARYLGALYRQTGATVTSIDYNDVTYTWNADGTNKGSNWEDASGTTLVSAVVAGIGSYDPLTGLVFTLSDGVHTENVTFKFVILDTTSPVVNITSATANGLAMDGTLEDGYELVTTNDPDLDHLLQIEATVDAPLADEYFGLYFMEGESTVTAAELQAYYAARGTPDPYLTYLNEAADGVNPFVYIKEAALSLSLVDAAKHDIQSIDVDMTVPDDFPLGTYVVRGMVADEAGNETEVTLILIVTGDRVSPTIESGVAKSASDGDVNLVDGAFTVDQGYVVDMIEITMDEDVLVDLGTIVTMEGYGPYGTITANVDGVITITPYPGYETAALIGTFTFTVADGSITDLAGNLLETLSVTLVVNNVAPVALDDTYATDEDIVLNIAARGVLVNDTDFDPTILTAVMVTEPDNGTLVLNADGSFIYTPEADFNGTDSFAYKANDGLADSNIATVTITVTSVLDAPTVSSTNLPGPYMVGLEQEFQVTLTNPDNGDDFTNVLARFRLEDLTLADIASFQYLETSVDPDAWMPLPLTQDGTGVIGDFGPATGFPMAAPYSATSQFKVTFNTAGTYPATIVLYDVAADPDVELDSYEADVVVVADFEVTDVVLTRSVDQTTWVNVPGNFTDGFAMPLNTSEDYYYFDVSTLTATRPLVDGSYPFYLTETPGAEFFAYWAAKGVMEGATDWQGLMWDIINGDAPMFYLKVEGTNYSLIDGLQGEPNLLRINGDYYPGAYAFSGIVEDEYGFTDEVPVDIIFNDIPVAIAQTVSTDEDTAVAILLEAVDLYPGTLSWSVVNPANGTLSGYAPSLTYTPDADWHGSDSFTFSVNDGTLGSNTATVNITVTSVNDAPVAVEETYSTSFETALTVATVDGVLANDTDVDLDTLTAEMVSDVTNGTLVLAADGSFVYTPDTAFVGVDTFTYKANDGTLDSNIVTVSITVTSYVNNPPVAVADAYATDQNVELVIGDLEGVLANDYDVDGDELTATLKTNVTNGVLVLKGDGSFTYTPKADFCGTDSFVYTLVSYPNINNNGWTAEATATITVYCDPIISSDDLDGPFYVGNEQEFHVTLTNLEYGHDFTNVLARFRLEDITLADIASFQYLETSVEPDVWMDLPLSQDGTDVIGDFGPAAGFPMGAPYSATSQFKVNFNTAGIHPGSIVLYDVAIDPAEAIASYSDTMVVAGLNAQDFGYMYFSDVMGVSAGFLPVNFTLDMADSIVVELFSGPETAYELLQKNTAISPAAMAAWTQFSGPFDIFGTFDYAADGVWTNVRESEYGQTEIPTRVLATVTLPGGITLTAENTILTGERGYIIDTFDEELASAPEYDYSPPYVPVGDVDFDLTSNTYTGTYTAPQVLAGSPMNDMARYLGALYRQPGSTITFIVYNGTTYTWDTTGTLVGSNWEDSTGKTLISQVTDDFLAAVAAGTWDPDAGFVMTVHDDYGHSATVTFLLVILNTLDAEIASAPDYDYDPVYTWVGNWSFDDPANIYTLTYDDTTFAPGAMNDLARYLGALYRQNGATVAAIVYDGTTYTWQIIGNELKGSNWRDASGTTLMSVITADVLAGEVDPITGLILTLSDVFHTENVTFKLVINDTIAPMLGAITAFGADGFDDVLAIGTTITVDQGYTVDHTEVVVNEPVIVADGTVVTLAGQPYGTITVDETGLILIITPYPGNEIANLAGSFVFSAPNGTITDLSGNPLETLSLTLIVNNVAPVAVADAYTTLEDTVLTVAAPGVLANDVDYDVLSATLIGDVSNGSLTFKPDGGFEYTPALNWHGTDTFTYKANDGSADTEIVTVSITVTDEKDQVQAVDDAYETNEGETLTVAAPGVLFNDIDVDMNIMTAGLVTDVAHGQLTLNGDGSFVYIPDADFYGTDSFEYQLVTYPAPMSLWTDIAEVTITVHQISGTIEPDGGTGQIPGGTPLTITNVGDNVSYLGEIAWYPADASVGRTAGNRVGVEINAPAGFDTSNTTFTVFGSTYNWDNVKDGDNFIWIYPKVTEVPQNWEIVVAWNPGATQTFTVDVLTGSTLQAPKLGTIERDPGNTGDVPGGTPLAVSQVGDAISFAGEVAWYPADLSAGRTEGNRVGVQVNAPAGFDTTNTTFTVFGSTYSWDAVNDGDNFVWIYPKVTEIPQSWDIVVTWEAGNVQTFTVEVLTGSTIDDSLALEWLQDNTVLSSTTGMVDDLTATFPASIPEVIVAEDYVIDSRMTLADPLPAGSTVTVFRDGIQILTDITLDGIGPFWFTELFDPDAPRAGFNANYDGQLENYSIVVTGPGGNPMDFDTTVLIESVISKDGFTTETVLDDITLGIHIPADESAALEWLQDNTVLSSVSMMVDDLTATFPASIPPVIVAEDYVIDSRMTLAEALPAGSTVTVFKDGVEVLTDITLSGVGPFWFTELFDPDAPRAAFDANYDGKVENYVIVVTGPGGNLLDFNTTVLIESVISKDGFTTETVLDDITLGIHIPADESAALEWLQDNTVLSSVSGMVDDLTATFPASIPPVIVAEDYVIDSRMTLAAPLPMGSTVTVFRDGVQILTDITLNGVGPFWFTQLFEPDAPRAAFDANYGGQVEEYSIIVTGPGGLPADFDTTVLIESVISKDSYVTETVLDDITLGIHLDDGTAPSVGSGVARSASGGDVNLVDGKFTVNQGYTVDTIEITMNEPVLVDLGTVITMEGYGPYGTITSNVDGVVTITPYSGNETAALIGTFTFTAPQGTITDLAGNAFTGNITLIVLNVAPVAVADTYTVAEDGVLTVTARGVLINDTDYDPAILTAVKVTDPANGTLVLNADGSFTYTPAADFNGTDIFTYKANDGHDDSNVATVSITVTPVNDAPVAVDDEYTVAEKAVLTIAAPGILANDSDVDGDVLTANLVDGVTNGTLTLNADGSFVYTPNEYFNGTDSFTYLASDGTLQSELATVTITVTPVNDWPIANDDFYETLAGVMLDVAAPGVLGNDVLLDPDEEVSIQILDAPQHGTLSMNDDGAFTYTPDAGFMGTDTFRYLVTSVQVNAEWNDDAMVTIVVKPFQMIHLPLIFK